MPDDIETKLFQHPDMDAYRRQLSESLMLERPADNLPRMVDAARRLSGEGPAIPDRTNEWYHAMAALPSRLTEAINDALAPLGWRVADHVTLHQRAGGIRNRLGAHCELELSPRPALCKFSEKGMCCTDEADDRVNNGGYCVRHYGHVSAKARIEDLFSKGILSGTDWDDEQFRGMASGVGNYSDDYALNWDLLAWAFGQTGGDAGACVDLYLSVWTVRYDDDACREWYQQWCRLYSSDEDPEA